MMHAASFDRRIHIQEPVAAGGPFGGEHIVWTNVTSAPLDAAIRHLEGKEAIRGGQLVADVETMITVRWDPDLHSRTVTLSGGDFVLDANGNPVTSGSRIDAAHRVVDDRGEIHEIVRIVPIERQQGLELLCRSERSPQ